MSTASAGGGAQKGFRLRSGVAAWPRWAPVAAAVVLSGYAGAAAVGLFGGPYVFVLPSNPDNVFAEHWLARQPRRIVEVLTLGIGLAGAAAMLLQMRGVTFGRHALITAGVLVAGFTLLVLPGKLALDAVPGLNLLNLKRLDWPTVHLVLLLYAGIAVSASTVAYLRRVRGACVHCGRRGGHPDLSSQTWTVIGTVASVAALLAPLGYASSRLLWALGVPVGTTPEFLAQINANNPANVTVILELSMVAMAVGGGVLCLGLSRSWSQTWPRWIPGAAGRPVPHWFPVTLAFICGIALCGVGAQLVPDLVRFAAGDTVFFPGSSVPTTWVSHIPGLSLLLWGPLVLTSAAAFHYRTRSSCVHCGRG